MLFNLLDNRKKSFKLSLATTHLICERVDTPRSLAVSLMLQYEEWMEYLDLSINASDYEDPSNFAGDYLVTEILRKSPDFPLGIDRARTAMDSFMESEAQCKATNDRLDSMLWPEVTHRFQRNILKILGPLTGDDIQFIESRFGHGPGATTGVAGRGSVLSDKYDNAMHLTTDLIPFYRSIVGEQWWEHHRQPIEVVEGNKFTTVPKSAKTDRGICIEPTLNMYVQRGIGACLRKRLRKFGINLNRQAEVNRELASRAIDENLCTIDLSRASDSLASKLIHHFFPERWYHLLSIARSPKCDVGSAVIELEKWSSMGNGYTFELETLVFYALCMSVVPRDEMHNVSVYGDDIIIPRRYATALIDALTFFGFEVNASKSYLAGNFFESCGHDYFKGQYVRPFYLKAEKDGIPFALQTANKLRIYSSARLDGWACDDTFRDVWNFLVSVTPRRWVLYVPESLGDSGLIVSEKEALEHVKKPLHGVEGWIVRHMTFRPIYKRKITLGVLLSSLAKLEKRPDSHVLQWLSGITSDGSHTLGREPKRGYLGRPQPRKTIVSQWSQGLCWVSTDDL